MGIPSESAPEGIRIGELSRRVGVSDHTLRAWESRYGVLQPARSDHGYRLYSAADEQRIHRMQAFIAAGLSAAEAARAALRDDAAPPSLAAPSPPALADAPGAGLAAHRAALANALDAYDEPAAQAVLDRVLADVSLPTALREVVMPYLAELGERWAAGEVSVAQEHFASAVLRGRLAGLARGWGSGRGPLAVLACPSGEQHDLALMAFGLVLRLGGWRVQYLGTSTPVADVTAVAAETGCELVVLASTIPGTLEEVEDELRALAQSSRLALAGVGATPALADAVGAELLAGDPVDEAARIWAVDRG